MTKNLYAHVSRDYDTASPAGVLVAFEHIVDGYGFTEKGYDTADYDAAPNVLSIESRAERIASSEDVRSAAVEAGVLPGPDGTAPHAGGEDWEEREANEMITLDRVRDVLDARGFDAFRDYIVINNDQPMAMVFWKPGSFAVEGPVPVVEDGMGYWTAADRKPTDAPRP